MFVKQDEGARQNELRALWQEAFPEDSAAYLDYLFAHKYRPEFCRLLLKGEELAAALHVLPLSFSLCGRALELPFYYGVATFQKFRYQGCAKTLLRASLYELREKGIKVGLFRPITVWPFPYKELKEACANAKALLDVEANEGQMCMDVKLAVNGTKPVEYFGHCGSLMPTTGEIVAKILEMKEGK